MDMFLFCLLVVEFGTHTLHYWSKTYLRVLKDMPISIILLLFSQISLTHSCRISLLITSYNKVISGFNFAANSVSDSVCFTIHFNGNFHCRE